MVKEKHKLKTIEIERILKNFQTNGPDDIKVSSSLPYFIIALTLLVLSVILLWLNIYSFAVITIFLAITSIMYALWLYGRYNTAMHYLMLGQSLDAMPQGLAITSIEGRSYWCNKTFRMLLPGVLPNRVRKGHIIEGLTKYLRNAEDLETIYKIHKKAASGFEADTTIIVEMVSETQVARHLIVTPVSGANVLMWQIHGEEYNPEKIGSSNNLANSFVQLNDSKPNMFSEKMSLSDMPQLNNVDRNVALDYAKRNVNHLPCAWFSVKETGEVQYANESFCKLFDVDADDIKGGNVFIQEFFSEGEYFTADKLISLMSSGVRSQTGGNGKFKMKTAIWKEPVNVWLFQREFESPSGEFSGSSSIIVPQPAIAQDWYKNTESNKINNDENISFSNIPVPMVWVDSDLVIKNFTHDFQYLWPNISENLIGKNLLSLFEKDNQVLLADYIERLRSGAVSLKTDIYTKTIKDEPSRIRLSLAQRIKSDASLILTLEDKSRVDDQIKAIQEEKLELQDIIDQRQKDEIIGKETGRVIHDIKNHLQTILSALDNVERNTDATMPYFSDIQSIATYIKKIENLTKTINRFNRKSGTANNFSVNELLRQSKTGYQSILGQSVILRYKLSGKVKAIHCDETDFDKVLLNLLTNARDSIIQDGEVLISTREVNLLTQSVGFPDNVPSGLWNVISVKDSGSGIDSDIITKIFKNRFSTKKSNGGTGLGLSDVYDKIHKYQGYIQVQSQPGEGTTFLLWFPSSTSVEEAKKPIKKAEELFDYSGNERILLVEDEESARKYTAQSLRNKGYDVTCAVDGIDGLEKFTKTNKSFDLIISDLSMPRMEGAQMVCEIRKIDPNMPVLIISGNMGEDLENDLKLIKPVAFLSKPYTLEGLVSKVYKLINAKNNQQKWYSKSDEEALNQAIESNKEYNKKKTTVTSPWTVHSKASDLLQNEVFSEVASIPPAKDESTTVVKSEAEVTQKTTRNNTANVTDKIILVVEDNDVFRGEIVHFLLSNGHEVFDENDGDEGLDTAQNLINSLDIIITDMSMGYMNGDEMAEKIWDVRPNLPIIFLSGHGATNPEKYAAYPAYFLEKPIAKEAILNKINQILS